MANTNISSSSRKNKINQINQSCLCCVYCGKSYKSRKNIDKHLVLCETIYKCKNNRNAYEEEEEIELPSQTHMYKIILELTDKYNKLEEKMEQMTKWIDKKKKKINVIEWMNTNTHPTFTFEDFNDKIHISNTEIERMMSSGVLDTIHEILSRNIFQYTDNDNRSFPIICFEQKTNYIYVYTNKDDSLESPCWMELERDKLICLMNRIHKMLTKGLLEWKTTNIAKHMFSDQKADAYNKTIVKLMDVTFTNDSTFTKIKSIIYGITKIDLTSIIEYEFEL
jgi:hypothetical protein